MTGETWRERWPIFTGTRAAFRRLHAYRTARRCKRGHQMWATKILRDGVWQRRLYCRECAAEAGRRGGLTSQALRRERGA